MNSRAKTLANSVNVLDIHAGRAGHRDTIALELHATTINVKAHITTHTSINPPYGSTLRLITIPVKNKAIAIPHSQLTCFMLVILLVICTIGLPLSLEGYNYEERPLLMRSGNLTNEIRLIFMKCPSPAKDYKRVA